MAKLIYKMQCKNRNNLKKYADELRAKGEEVHLTLENGNLVAYVYSEKRPRPDGTLGIMIV